MTTGSQPHEVARAHSERLCYYCNEGHCALCNGWDRTIVRGTIVEVPCAHTCRREQRKANARVEERSPKQRRA